MNEPTERERLSMLERAKDPDTIRILESLPTGQAPRCLEIGAGTGSIAHWLGTRFPDGHVIAADIDTRHLHSQRTPNVHIRELDISSHQFEPASFDLIHARAVLCHLPTRNDILARALEWLAPGGWLLVEDVYTLPVGSSPYPAMNRYAEAAHSAAHKRGADMQWGSRLPGILSQLGFAHVNAEGKLRLIGAGGLPDDLWRTNLTQAGRHMVKNRLLDQDDLDECLALLDDPGFLDIRYVGIAAWGQRPSAQSAPGPQR